MNWLKMSNPILMDEVSGAEGGGGGDPAPTGALSPDNSTPAPSAPSEGGEQAYDFANATPQDYFSKVEIPSIEGVEFNKDAALKNYGQFCIDNKISPEVLTKYLALEGKLIAEQNKVAEAESAEESAAERKNFEAQGVALKREFSPQQIDTAVEALSRDFSQDKDFMRYATREMSNNPSLVRLLVNWAETHSVDKAIGVGSGSSGSGAKGFAARWTGKNY